MTTARSGPYWLGPAVPDDVTSIAAIWQNGWREAHLGRVPEALVRARKPESFRTRTATMLPRTVVARRHDEPARSVVGFVTVAGDEVEQLYVHPDHRGTGVADRLLTAAETAIASAGYAEAWLAVVAGNSTARAFYQRQGWRDQGPFDHHAPGPEGPISLPAHRYGRTLQPRDFRVVVDDPGGVRLRRPVPADSAGVLAVHGDPRVYEHDPQEVQHELADAVRFLAPMLDHWAEHGFGYWTVLVPRAWWTDGPPGPDTEDGDRVTGGMGGFQHHRVAGEPVLNVYFRLAPAIHGRGIALLTVREAADLAARVAPRLDLVIRTRPANLPARRVAERAGFVDLGPEPGADNMQLYRRRSASKRS